MHHKILSCIHFKAKGHQTTVRLIVHPFTLCTVIYPPMTLLGNWLPQKSGKAYPKKRKINLCLDTYRMYNIYIDSFTCFPSFTINNHLISLIYHNWFTRNVALFFRQTAQEMHSLLKTGKSCKINQALQGFSQIR